MTSPSYLPLFELTRGDCVESVHFGAIAVADKEGRLLAWHGDSQVVTFMRSSAKPFQALPFLERGGQSRFNLTPREIALICASHSGADEHLQVVRSIQEKTGVREEELLCGVHPVYHKETALAMQQRGEHPTPNRNNCSGKHSAMLAYARMLGLGDSFKNQPYIDPAHPVQVDILEAFAAMCAVPTVEIKMGIDGCSAPNFAIPLHNAALAFARLCDPRGLPEERAQACRAITNAMTSHPEMIGGPDSFDTHLMQVTQGRLVCKGGAEGYQALGLLPDALAPGSQALGIALKISDGDLKGRIADETSAKGQVRPAVVIEVLRQLGALSQSELEKLAAYGPSFPVSNWRKLQTGRGYPCFTLLREYAA